MSNLFELKVALIVGGSSGVGQTTALAFAKEGAKIVVAARRIAEGKKVVSIIKEEAGEACFVQTDVSKTSEVEAMVATCIETYGRLDYAFNNAGIEGSILVSTTDYDEETWDQVIDINLKAVWLCMKYEIPQVLKRRKGAIVNMSSVAGLEGGWLMGVYYFASKHGVFGLTRAAALNMMTKRPFFETKPYVIITIVIHPGWIKTDMGGLRAKITMKESVSGMLHVIDNLKMKDNGKFLGWDGKEVP